MAGEGVSMHAALRRMSATPETRETYKAEPHAIAADV
jgi:hypothetical protein